MKAIKIEGERNLSPKEFESCVAFLKSNGYRYRCEGYSVFLPRVTLKELNEELKEYVDVSTISKELSQTQKKKLLIFLKDNDFLITSPAAILLNKRVVDYKALNQVAELIEIIKEDNAYITAGTIRSKYGVTARQLAGAVKMGRVRMDAEERFHEADVLAAIENDERLVSIEAYFESICDKNNLVLANQLKERLIDEIVRWPFLEKACRLEEAHMCKIEKKDKTHIFVAPSDDLRSNIEAFFESKAHLFGSNNYIYMWTHLSEFERDAVCEIYAATPFEANTPLQPALNNVMASMVRDTNDLSTWTNGTVEFNIHIAASEAKRDIKKFLLLLHENKGISLPYNPKEIIFHRKKVGTQVDTQPYSIDQYLDFGKLIFADESFWGAGIIDTARENSECACALFQAALCFGAAWRNPDIERLVFPEQYLLNLDELIEQIREHTIDTDAFYDIWKGIQEGYVTNFRSKKNFHNISLFLSEGLYVQMGVIVAVCEYHRIRKKRIALFTNKGISLSTYKKLFGQKYIDIFGEKTLSSKRLYKDFLLIQAAGCFGENYPVKTLSALICAFIRGHKLDFEHGQQTIFYYIPHNSEGLSVDDVAFLLFKIGTLGFYKDLVAKCIVANYEKMNFELKSEILTALDVTPIEVESQIATLTSLHSELAFVSQDIGSEIEVIMEKIAALAISGTQNANEKYVSCLYKALYGEANPECRCGGNCLKSDGLCRWGIYSSEYIYILRENKQIMEDEYQRVKRLAEAGYITTTVFENEKKRYAAAIKWINGIIDKFLCEVEKNEKLADTVYSIQRLTE